MTAKKKKNKNKNIQLKHELKKINDYRKHRKDKQNIKTISDIIVLFDNCKKYFSLHAQQIHMKYICFILQTHRN